MIIMIYACNSCYYLFASEDVPEQCRDCGKDTVRPASPEEVQEFMSNRHTELQCYASYRSGHDAAPVPRTRISVTGNGIELVGETGLDGVLKFTENLVPGSYSAEILEVPVGFVYEGERTSFNVQEGEVTVLDFFLAEK